MKSLRMKNPRMKNLRYDKPKDEKPKDEKPNDEKPKDEKPKVDKPEKEVILETGDDVNDKSDESSASEVEAETVKKEVTKEKEEEKVKEKVAENTEEVQNDIEQEEIEETEENYIQYSREELVEILETAVQEEDISSIKTKVALIKVRFLQLTKDHKQELYNKFLDDGGNKEDYKADEDKLELRFNEAFEIYKKNKAAFVEKQEEIKQENLKLKNDILEELKELIASEETLKKTYDDFKELQERWKNTGMVPKNEINTLWQNYHFLVEKFFDKVKINKELKDLDLKKNLEQKVKLCEQAEELLLETSILKSFKELQKLHDNWKEIGPVMEDKKDEIWERFKRATDKINEGRREFYNKIQDDQNNNYLAKVALCEKAETILSNEADSIKKWQENTNEINELFRIWRTIGPAPKKDNDEIWTRFKTLLDTFYSNKKDYFGKIKEQQLNNYNLKFDLCVQAEAMKHSTDWKKTTRDLIRLQQDWKNIGPVPRKNSDKIWKRFRAACDEFFNAKSEYFSNIKENEGKNLELKNDLIEKIKKHEFGEDKNENLDVLKGFQREWMEIGHVPIKDKDSIQKEFRSVIDELLNKLKISNVEISAVNYKTRLESMINSPGSDRILSKERSFIQSKISKLREDITLWENNMGFFANTKKANLLKEEFDKKVQKSKQEIALLEAKLKYLREAK
jgi:hypothetical protein